MPFTVIQNSVPLPDQKASLASVDYFYQHQQYGHRLKNRTIAKGVSDDPDNRILECALKAHKPI